MAEVGGRAEQKLALEAELASETFRSWTANALNPLHERLAGIAGAAVGTQHHHAIHVLLPDETLSSGEKRDQFSMATSLQIAGHEDQLHCAIGMQYFSDGRTVVAAGFFISPPRIGSGLWTGRAEATLGSIALADAISDLTTKLHEGFGLALSAFMKRVGA